MIPVLLGGNGVKKCKREFMRVSSLHWVRTSHRISLSHGTRRLLFQAISWNLPSLLRLQICRLCFRYLPSLLSGRISWNHHHMPLLPCCDSLLCSFLSCS